ncbi:hypothetical protein [Nocardia vinacea]|uniref:hypothetical protein n=1 Tax=Nocardia vinacea TaxID=96468 RepID=UPI0002F1C725|nr:hypothetical protein [Nocardia vinacea]
MRPRVAVIGGTVLYLAWSIWAFLPGSGGIAEVAEVLDVVAMREGYTGSFDVSVGSRLRRSEYVPVQRV